MCKESSRRSTHDAPRRTALLRSGRGKRIQHPGGSFWESQTETSGVSHEFRHRPQKCGKPGCAKVRASMRCRLRDAALSYQQPLHNLRMGIPRAESSPSNCATPGEVSRSPGTMTAHSRFSRNSFDLICHCPKDDDFAWPIWTMDQCRTSISAAASSGNGPDRMKWLFPCTRIPTMLFQASRRGSVTG